MSPSDDPLIPRPPRAKRWTSLIVAILLVAFATVVLVQWRQLSLMNTAINRDGDNLAWSFYQIEAELTRLRFALREALRDPAAMDRAELQLRYDIFVSRIPLVSPDHTAPVVATAPIQVDTVARLRALVAEADPLLGPTADAALDPAALRRLEKHLDRLADPVQDFALWGNEKLNAKIADRHTAMRQQTLISIGLTLFQSLLTIAFAVIVARQLRALEIHGHALEQFAHRLQDARRDAEAASRTKSAFLANMSHELRTPFQGLLGMLALVGTGPLTPRQSTQLKTATDSANHLLGLLNDVLDTSTLEGGHLRLDPQPCSLHRLLDEVEALMATPARAKGLELRAVRDPDLPDLVLADAKRLKQILFNLMNNALKFTDDGGVMLRTRVVDGDNAGAQAAGQVAGHVPVRFEIRDTGIGMDAPTIARLFQRFSQGDETSSRRFGGTGLGLEISRSLARLMGGDIEVASEIGAGSRFTLCVAFALAPPAAADPPAPTAIARPSPPLPPLRVLVADDHPINRQYLQALLSAQGHRVTLCEDGAAALEAATRERFDVVLMDLHMPKLDGFDATRAIRALPRPARDVPIIALTADAFAETRETTAQAGMNGFLPKPARPADLIDAFGRLFSPHAAADTGAATPWLDRVAADLSFGPLDATLHAQLLQLFFDDRDGTLALLLASLDKRNVAQARRAAHAARGAALSLGLAGLCETARLVESLDDVAIHARAAELHERVRDDLAASRSACVQAGWLAELPTASTRR